MCASSCALIWIGGETGRKFQYLKGRQLFASTKPRPVEPLVDVAGRLVQGTQRSANI